MSSIGRGCVCRQLIWYSCCFLRFIPQIHWFSIFNSFMMVVFLIGLVAMILVRTLHKDYARYSKDEEIDDMVYWIHFVYRKQCNEKHI